MIVSREQWGARHPGGFREAPLPAREVWLHHSVTIAPDLCAPFDDDYAAIRQLEEIGEGRFGGGISYTWLVTPIGLIFEGHGVDREGAHTGGHNTAGRAICLVGNYEDQDLTPAQMDAVVWLLRHGREMGWWVSASITGGHRDTKATECPGDRAYAAIAELNRRAAGHRAPVTDAPAPPPPPAALPTLRYGMRRDPRVARLQSFLRHVFPSYAGHLPSTGNYLSMTVAVVREFQARAGVTGSDADGTIVGPRTNAALRRYGYR